MKKIVNFLHRLIEFIARKILLFFLKLSGPARAQPPLKDPLLLDSATALARKIRNREISSQEVVKAYIQRIEEIQPILNCVCEDRFEEALKEAKKCDELLNSPDCPSQENLAKEKPFLGVPFTTKDSIAIENMKQTAGLVIRKNCRASKDAEPIRLMRKAGAIPLAVTNISELAMWWESSNYVYGTTNNPYNTWHIVGGSSGGEGCIQAAAGSPFGLGSDIGGSIRMPSFFNGIFGHKPSKGIVSNEGQYPDVETEEQKDLLQVGPMCRYATDLAPILEVIADKNANLLNLKKEVNLSKLRIYYMEENNEEMYVTPVETEIQEALLKVVDHLKKSHKAEIKKVKIHKFRKSLDLWFAQISNVPEKDFSYELSDRKNRVNLIWEYLKWFTFTSNHTFAALMTALVERFTNIHGSEIHNKLKRESKELQEEVQNMLGEDGVLLYPTHPTAAPLHNEPIVKPFNFSYTAIFNVLGLPVTACPLGLNKEGLPIGIQVVAGLNKDHITLALAREIQREFKGWVPVI